MSRKLSQLLPSANLLVLTTFVLSVACSDSTAPLAVPVPDTPLPIILRAPNSTQVTVGYQHTCALKSDGSIKCWGGNGYGQATPPEGMFTQIDAGYLHTCALKNDGSLACWGRLVSNYQTLLEGTYTQVSAGLSHTCAIDGAGAIICGGETAANQGPPPGGVFTQVTAGDYHTCGLKTDGSITCWGANGSGQAVPPNGTFTQVSAGEIHTCAVRTDRSVACWGDNRFGQSTPPRAPFVQVVTGTQHTCGIKTDGSIACWGNVPGTGEFRQPAGVNVVQLSGGYDHLCAILSDVEGDPLACWGSNTSGQLVPTGGAQHINPVATFNAPTSVVAGQPFTLSLTSVSVPGYPAETEFTYAFDCGDGAFYSPESSTPSQVCPTTIAESRTVKGLVIDRDRDAIVYTATVAVTSLAQTISFTTVAPSPAYVGEVFSVAAVATSGLTVTLSISPETSINVCTLASGTLTLVGAGSCTVMADQAGNPDYQPAPQQTQTVEINRRAQTIALNPLPPPAVVLGSTLTLVASGGSSGNPIIFDSQTRAICRSSGTNGRTLSLVAVGSCTVAGSQAGNTEFEQATPLMVEIIVLSAAEAVTRLRAAVLAAPLAPNLRQALTEKLDDALSAFTSSQTSIACGALRAFANQVRAKTDKGINATTVSAWLAEVADIDRAAGC